MLDASAAVVKAMERGIILGWRRTCRINFEDDFEANDNNMAQKQLLWYYSRSAGALLWYFVCALMMKRCDTDRIDLYFDR